jgi:predicted Zn-dependent peptidase
MSQDNPQNIGELWLLIQRDSDETRESLRRELDDMKDRLSSFVTKDHFEAEKRLLEARILQAEQKLERLDREASEAARTRQQNRREFVYKGIIPVLALVVAIVAAAASIITST